MTSSATRLASQLAVGDVILEDKGMLRGRVLEITATPAGTKSTGPRGGRYVTVQPGGLTIRTTAGSFVVDPRRPVKIHQEIEW